MKNKKNRTPAAAKSAPHPPKVGRFFVFEFTELKDNKTIGAEQFKIEANTEAEAWILLGKKLDKDNRALVYAGKMYIEQALKDKG